ncbi:MAG TPA: GAF domain-containing protein, partial [Pyrinomonadaceae bacterium]|nr:GAF domain-containing protein [Pyrinomonadaceae bacterium]
MEQTETVRVRTDVSRDALTARLNRALTIQSLVQALADETTSNLVAFDYCQLVLPESDNQGIRIWRATRAGSAQRPAMLAVESEADQKLFTEIMTASSPRLLGDAELRQHSPAGFERDVRSVLALPLIIGGHCLGLLCFASAQPEAYSAEDQTRLAWL